MVLSISLWSSWFRYTLLSMCHLKVHFQEPTDDVKWGLAVCAVCLKGFSGDLIRPGVGRHFGNWEWQCCSGDRRYYLTLHLELVLELNQIQWPVEMSQQMCWRACGCL